MSDEAPSAAQPNRLLLAARALALAGVLLITTGAALIYRPAGFIVCGALLLVIALGALRA